MDNAPQHKAKVVGRFLKGNKNVKAIWLPAATPELSVMYWHQAKRDVLVSEYYATIGQMRRAMSEYFRTARSGLDAMSFICRRSFDLKNFCSSVYLAQVEGTASFAYISVTDGSTTIQHLGV